MPEVFALKKSIVFTETDYGGALLNDRTGQYWQLNATSAAIVSGLQSGLDVTNVVQQLVDRFDGVDEATASSDVDTVIEQLRAAGIVQ